jgi:hypothetical protein
MLDFNACYVHLELLRSTTLMARRPDCTQLCRNTTCSKRRQTKRWPEPSSLLNLICKSVSADDLRYEVYLLLDSKAIYN